jgi:hypothetical protein
MVCLIALLCCLIQGRSMRRIAVFVAILAVWPNAAKADELSEMKAALSAAMGSIHALQERVKVLEQEKQDKEATASIKARKTKPPVVVVRPAVPPPLVTAAPVVAPDLKPVGPVPEAEKARLEIHGSVQLDAIYDFKKVNPNWEGTLRPSQIPVNCPPVGCVGEAAIPGHYRTRSCGGPLGSCAAGRCGTLGYVR